ncbi:MAG: ferritin [Proteobacteria bacterium]|nr:ferritin [Pseudomonadota bacterium]
MLGEKIEKAFNAQLNAEGWSAYLYLSMSAWFSSQNLPGLANWMRVQAREEMVHAMKFFDYIQSRGGRVNLTEVAAPSFEWKTPLDAFENVLAHERKVTGLIHALVDLAAAEKDHAASSFLRWFVDEQVEEEESAEAAVCKLKLAGDAPGGLFLLDREMAERVFTPPAGSKDA